MSDSNTPPRVHDPRRPDKAFGCGFLMGTADAIPGVSGGTMALILGIYELFIEALNTVLRLPVSLRSEEGRRELKAAFLFLIPLGAGVGTALFLATRLLVGRREEQGLIQDPATAPYFYAFFFGLVVVSAGVPWNRIREHSLRTRLLALAGVAGAFVFAGLEKLQHEPETWMLAGGGALAISVMLLPGISGSLLLVLLNQYQAVVEALHDRNIIRLLVFVAGVGTGAVLFVPLLRRLLRTAHDPTMAVLTGLMVGSLRALWPWKENYDHTAGSMRNLALERIGDAGAPTLLVLLAMIGGGAVILVLMAVERRHAGGRELRRP